MHAFRFALVAVWCSLPCVLASAQNTSAQNPSPQNPSPQNPSPQNAAKLSSKHIPDDGVVAAFLSPAKLMSSPDWELMPVEVIQAAGKEYVGIDPLHIEEAKVVVGLPGQGVPRFAVILSLSQDYAISDLNQKILNEFESGERDGLAVYTSYNQPQITLHQPNSRSLVISGGGYLQSVLAADGKGTGPLRSMTSKITAREGLTVIAAMEPIRPTVTGMLRGQVSRLPPQLRGISEVAELTDAVLLNVNLSMTSGNLSLSALARDEASAGELQQTLNAAIDFARDSAIADVANSMRGEGPVDQAMKNYLRRTSVATTEMMRPTLSGRLVKLEVGENMGKMLMPGVLTGVLLPAVQAARQAARRMTAANKLKQIGLAMHNHHAAYRQLPETAIRDDNGKPLLSWRVKVLPFVEQQALYEQFHLDEPWDSPHNRKLLEQMPDVYRHPAARTPPGHTVFQLPVGDSLMFQKEGETQFRDVTDGLSNTLMVVETDAASAVPWTKPADCEIDLSNPLAKMGKANPQGFNVLMGDGSVLFFANSIDSSTFRAMLTRAGQETINRPNF
jgi:hypothetical protein